MSASRTEIAPEQKVTLNALRASIAADRSSDVQAEAPVLQSAIDGNDRSEVMTTLRTLEGRLESLEAMDRHREKLQAAKYAVGYVTDNIDTFTEGTLDTAKRTVIDPLVDGAATYVPGAAAAMEAIKPATDTVKQAYEKLPTALRLPILGAVIAGSSYLASYPVKWLGKLVGYVSEHGEKALDHLSGMMKDAGKVALIGGGVLGAASFFGSTYRNGTFDPALDAVKGKPTAAGSSPTPTLSTGPTAAPSLAAGPSTGPSSTFEELKAGVTIDGKSVKFIDGPGVEVAGKKWNIKLPFGISFTAAKIEEGALIVEGKMGRLFSGTKKFSPETLQGMVNTLATTSEKNVAVTDDAGAGILGTTFEQIA